MTVVTGIERTLPNNRTLSGLQLIGSSNVVLTGQRRGALNFIHEPDGRRTLLILGIEGEIKSKLQRNKTVALKSFQKPTFTERTNVKLENLAIIAVLLPVATALTACDEEGFKMDTNDHFYEKATELLGAFDEPDNDKVMELACPDPRLYERAESGELDGAKEPSEVDPPDPKVSKVGVEEMGKEVITIIKPNDDYKTLAVNFVHPSPDSEHWCVTDMDQGGCSFSRN